MLGCRNPFEIRSQFHHRERVTFSLGSTGRNPFEIRSQFHRYRSQWHAKCHRVVIPSKSGLSFIVWYVHALPRAVVVIPSKSGLSFIMTACRQPMCRIRRNPFEIRSQFHLQEESRQPSSSCRNPFEIRSQFHQVQETIGSSHIHVVIPSKSGLSFIGEGDQGGACCGVVIPSKSGLSFIIVAAVTRAVAEVVIPSKSGLSFIIPVARRIASRMGRNPFEIRSQFHRGSYCGYSATSSRNPFEIRSQFHPLPRVVIGSPLWVVIPSKSGLSFILS